MLSENYKFFCKIVKKKKMINVVLGASPNERRYSFKATERLSENGHFVIAVGVKTGSINGVEIQSEYPISDKIDSLAMYLSIENQEKYYDKILSNLPRRVIFNPGTYNPHFQQMLINKGVEVVNDCVLIMLNRGTY